jgi:hypothetical protein
VKIFEVNMKILTPLTVLFFLINSQIIAQESNYDTTAILLLDRMGEVIGDLKSCSFSVSTSIDQAGGEIGLIKYFIVHQVYMSGPDKMLINSRGDKGHSGFWYNGKQLTYYSYSEHNYAIIEAASTIIATIDTINKTYGIEFPAADFFYPSFTDDLIEHNDQIKFIGKSNIEDINCFHISARNNDINTQIWISDDAFFLPVKLVISYNNTIPNTQYEATYSDWVLNPDLPNAVFEFTPPAGANKLRLIKK